MVDAGNPVIILGHQRVRARGSGIEFEIPFANVVSFERGLIARQRDFTDAHEALRASGIATGGAGGNSGTREGSL